MSFILSDEKGERNLKKFDYIFDVNDRMKTVQKQTEFLDCQLCLLRKKGKKYCSAYNCISLIKTKTQEEYASLCRERLDMYTAISKVKDLRIRTLLEYRYVYLMSYEDIAETTNYSVRQTIRKIQEGFKEIKKLSKNELNEQSLID